MKEPETDFRSFIHPFSYPSNFSFTKEERPEAPGNVGA